MAVPPSTIRQPSPEGAENVSVVVVSEISILLCTAVQQITALSSEYSGMHADLGRPLWGSETRCRSSGQTVSSHLNSLCLKEEIDDVCQGGRLALQRLHS